MKSILIYMISVFILRSIGVNRTSEEKILQLLGSLMERIYGTSLKPTPRQKYLDYLKKMGD